MTLLRSLVFSCPVSVAGFAATHVFVHPDVIRRVGMALRAVRNQGGAFLEGLYCRLIAKPAPQIFLQGHGLQVSYIDAAADPTQMVKLQPVWHRADCQFVKHSVSFPASLRADLNQSVAATVNRSRKEQAAGFRHGNRFRQDSFDYDGSIHVTPLQSHWSGLRSASTLSRPVINYTAGWAA